MSLSNIKEQILKNEAALKREQPEDLKFFPSWQMSVNEAAVKLVELKSLLEEEVRKRVRVNFIKIDDQTINLLGLSDFVMDHRMLVKEMVKTALPGMPLGTALSSFQIANLNNRMTELCLEVGVNSQMCPELYMDAEYQRIIGSEEQFVNIVEQMVEKMVKNRDFDEEGHTLQTIYLMKSFLAKVPSWPTSVEPSDVIDLYVLVPRISPALVEEYRSRFTTNMRTVAINEKANIILQSYDELLSLIVGSSAVPLSAKKVKKK